MEQYKNLKCITINLTIDETLWSMPIDLIQINKGNLDNWNLKWMQIVLESRTFWDKILLKSIKRILKLSYKLRIHELILTNFSNRHFKNLKVLRKYLSKINFLRFENIEDFDEEKDIKEELNLISLVTNLKDKNKTINIEIPISVQLRKHWA